MYLCRREDYLAVLDEKAVSGRILSSVESEIFEFDHPEVGSSLLKTWGLPESVYLPIRYHHEPENAPLEIRPLCQVIQASDQLSAVYYGSGSVKNACRVKDLLWNTFQIDERRAMQLIDAVAQKSDEVLSQFNIQSENTLSYSEILQNANEELSRLNISSQTLIIEYREAKQRADRLAAELKVANDKLRSVACRDDLTGLYNYRFFRESLGSELEFAERNRLWVSVIMFDIDNFKGINDSFGHHCGDLALQAVGGYLLQTSRASDIAARYGGDEFIILLRDTPLEGARIRAETICDELASIPVDCNGVQLGITASFGVAAYDPQVPMTRTELANLVDKAMYESKSKGRNRVSIQRGIA
jgi:diguanylate cyclase (GGDEF)-like protein